ncbi:MAG: response regulator [Bacteriovoracaceae bacterium]|jgi:CheY-like chemotaxis protein|nr:response regulator [Bacteriovoracaceae bacterium]
MKILVVDDEIEICHLIKLLFLADFPCQVDIVFNGKEAIDAISNEQFDLIICDQNMPEKNGNEVFQYINNNSINLPFVLATTEEWEHVPYFTTNPLFFQIQKPQIAEGITKLIKKLKDEPSDVRVEEGDLVVEFSPVPIEIIYKMGALPVDIYLKIRDGKFLKVIRAGDILSGGHLVRYRSKNVHDVYIENCDIRLLTGAMEKIFANFFNREKKGALKPDNIIAFQETLVEGFSLFPEDPLFHRYVTEFNKLMLEVATKYEGVEDILMQLMGDKRSYICKHASVSQYIGVFLARKMTWDSELSLVKVSMALLFQNISLIQMDLNDEIKIFDIQQNTADKRTVKRYREHSLKSAQMIGNLTKMPIDLDTLILEHHETPLGEGFPTGKDFAYISPLGAIVILSGVVAEYLLFNKVYKLEELSADEFLTKLEDEGFCKGVFKKFFPFLEELLIG